MHSNKDCLESLNYIVAGLSVRNLSAQPSRGCENYLNHITLLRYYLQVIVRHYHYIKRVETADATVTVYLPQHPQHEREYCHLFLPS